MKLKAQMRAEENEFIMWNDIQSRVDGVHLAVHEEHESKFCLISARLILDHKVC